MKRVHLILLVIFASLQWEAFAQYGEKSFFKEGKAWVIQRNYSGNNPALVTIKVSRKFALGGTMFWFLNVGNGTSEPYCCWQTDDGKIYAHDRNLEYFHNIEIDMSLEPGDETGYMYNTKLIPDSPERKLIPISCYKVVKKDTIEVRGVRRARLHVQPIYYINNELHLIDSYGYWVEGIGYASRNWSDTSFPTSGSYNTSYDFIACYEDGVLVFDTDDFDAPSVSEIREITAGTSVDPNGPVDVYNLQGQCIRCGVPRPSALRNLPSGIYIIDGKKVRVD